MRIIAILFPFFLATELLAGRVDPTLAAVERALPWVEEEGTWWIEEKKCASCHHSSLFVWAKDLAFDAGIAIDEPNLKVQREWVWDSMLSVREPESDEEEYAEDVAAGELNVEGVSQLLLSASADRIPPEAKELLVEVVRKKQNESGRWKANGQLPRQKRPPAETEDVSTRWALAALGERGSSEFSASAVSTEWYAIESALSGEAETLAARQNEDGGWSWKDGEASDPMATGQALFGLARSSDPTHYAEAMRRGREFLERTQNEKGYWDTFSTKDRKKKSRISNFFGTSWAIIGLLESIKQIRNDVEKVEDQRRVVN